MNTPYTGQREFDEWCEMRAVELVNDHEFYQCVMDHRCMDIRGAVYKHGKRVCGLNIGWRPGIGIRGSTQPTVGDVSAWSQFWDCECPGIAWAVMQHYRDYISEEELAKVRRGDELKGRFLNKFLQENRYKHRKPKAGSEWVKCAAIEITAIDKNWHTAFRSTDGALRMVKHNLSCLVPEPTDEEIKAVAGELWERVPERTKDVHKFADFSENLLNSEEPQQTMGQAKPNGITIETITYVNGTDVRELTNEQITELIRSEEEALEALAKLKARPKRVKADIAKRQATLDRLVKILDDMDEGPQTASE